MEEGSPLTEKEDAGPWGWGLEQGGKYKGSLTAWFRGHGGLGVEVVVLPKLLTCNLKWSLDGMDNLFESPQSWEHGVKVWGPNLKRGAAQTGGGDTA